MSTLQLERRPQPPMPPVRRISSVLRALDVLADPWSYLILREAFFGVRRFEGFQRNLQIARNSLASRLEHLIAEGVLERRAYSQRPPRFEYRLSAAGRDFFPAIVALMQWGDRWRPEASGPPLLLSHRSCGARLHPQVVCAACGEAVGAHDVDIADGPGAGPEQHSEQPSTRRSRSEDQYTRGRPCSVARTLSVIGDRWSFRLLRESFFGVKRFDELQARLGIARNILTLRLDSLVAAGVLARRLYQQRPDRYEYVLTPAGLDLYPALLLFMAWGDAWRRPAEGVPLVLSHRACGQVLEPRLVCAACDGAVESGSTRYEATYEMRA